MRYITNSELDPKEIDISELYLLLSDYDYLISLMQKKLCDTFPFDVDDENVGNITPNTYRKVMNVHVEQLRDDIAVCIKKAHENIKRGLSDPSSNKK